MTDEYKPDDTQWPLSEWHADAAAADDDSHPAAGAAPDAAQEGSFIVDDEPVIVASRVVDDAAPDEADSALPLTGGAPPGWWDRRLRVTGADVLLYGLLAVVLIVGAWLRFDGQNWDDYTHLHPDERFLTDVVGSLNGPWNFTAPTEFEREAQRQVCDKRYPLPEVEDTFSALTKPRGISYFDAQCSPLNPNNIGKGLYVYGEFPLFTVHAAGVARSNFSADYHAFLEAYDADRATEHTITDHWEGYSGAQLVGRSISALADWLTIVVLFLLGRRLYGRWTGLLAAALYAFAAFPIQQSHFWTVDAFTTFWVTLALYCAVRALDDASPQAGPIPFVYLLLWVGGTLWDAGYRDLPVLGLVTLGAAFVVSYALAAVIRLGLRAAGREGGGIVLAASGVFASLIYLAGWSALDAARLDGFDLANDITALGFTGLIYGTAVLIAFVAVGIVRRHILGMQVSTGQMFAVGVVGVMFTALALGYVEGDLSPYGVLLIALGLLALLMTDLTGMTDYLLFGLALGGAVASRVNVAPLAGIIVVAALIRALPVFDRHLRGDLRMRLVLRAMAGVIVAALASMVVFRLLQPHAFLGPGLFDIFSTREVALGPLTLDLPDGINFNPGWQEDIDEAATLTSGTWDAPPNHQWASRTPYLFPWRNIVLWGMGPPLGLFAWAAWAWAGVAMFRARRFWTRHAIPFLWVLVAFGWLGGRWVTTMRYFLPIYPALIVIAAWALRALVVEAWARRRNFTPQPLSPRPPFSAGGERGSRSPRKSLPRQRGGDLGVGLALAGSILLLIVVVGYTVLYGFAFHTIQRTQLTRVAASRWFQETVPGDFGIWVEGDDGTRQMVNIGRRSNAPALHVFHLRQGDTTIINFTVAADANLESVKFNLLGDPGRDPEPETLRVRLFRDDVALGRQVLYTETIQADLNAAPSVYGQSYLLRPEEAVFLPALSLQDQTFIPYSLELTVIDGGPVMAVRDLMASDVAVLSDVQIGLTLTADGTAQFLDLNFDYQPILTGHGDDIPEPPTHWGVGGLDTVTFPIPINGVIREIEIPHLGDPLLDADEETVHFTLTGPDGATASATLTADFADGANPLGPPQTVVFDPPLAVQRDDMRGQQQVVTLTVDAEDIVYTSGPVIAWEGDWDDPVPWPACPLPDDVVFSKDLESGISDYDCMALNMYYSGFYQGLKLWMVAEDNDEKQRAMLNALDQADYIVITSNRFYDSLSRIPWRWPMSLAYYDALFDGSLGFELAETFVSNPRLGPFEIPDQKLPTDDLPDWMNEHWEAEEAFHVYDHPAVLVFKKTDAYSPENTRAILTSVSRRPVTTAIPGYVADPEPVGQIVQGAKPASEAPNQLHLTDDKWEAQQQGGTWSDLFDMDSLLNRSQIAAVIAWWLLMIVAGWIAWPLLFVSLPALPDRGYPAAKITAWLLIAWVAWVGGTLSLPLWTRGGLAGLTLALAALSLLVIWRRRVEFVLYIRAEWRLLVALEALALALFVAFLGVRQGNPDLWHNAFGGEKPMDFAYFNAVLRSSVFPPLDPWFSGGTINYYYFGYVIVGAPVKLLGIRPTLAYNLIIPALYAMTGVGVFSIAFNWVKAKNQPHPPAPSPQAERGSEAAESVGALLAAPGELSATQPHPPTPSVKPERGSQAPHDVGVPVGEGFQTLPVDEAEAPHTFAGRGKPTPLRDDLDTHSAKPKRGDTRFPVGNPWVAGLLALVLAVVLGNLATVRVFVTNVARLGGYERPPLYDQMRRQELDSERLTLYNDYYNEELDAFEDEMGRPPQLPEETAAVAAAAQERVEAYIANEAEHPFLLDLWEYELEGNLDLLDAFREGLKEVAKGAELPMATHRWYWAPTRVISELPNGAGNNAIAEMPYFTFLYGDLHAHMLAFPITLLVLLWLLAEIIGAGQGLRTWYEAGIALVIGAIAVGVLRPTNSWDWITYLLLGAAGLTYVAWVDASRTAADLPLSPAFVWLWDLLKPERVRRLWVLAFAFPLGLIARVLWHLVQQMRLEQQQQRGLGFGEEWIDPTMTTGSALLWGVGAVILAIGLYVALLIAFRARINRRVLVGWIGRVGGFVALTFIAALPFTMYFATAYTSVSPWEKETTPLWAYLYVFGLFIFIVISFLTWQTARVLRETRVRDLRGLVVPVAALGGGLLAVVLVSIIKGARDVPVMQLTGPLIAWAGLLFFVPRQHPLVRAVYAIIVLALAISLGVELVVLDGDIGRQNTVFKFYLQVWFLLSIVGGVALAWMLPVSYRWQMSLDWLWPVVAVLVGSTLLRDHVAALLVFVIAVVAVYWIVRVLWRGRLPLQLVWQTALAILFSLALLYPLVATQARFLDRFNKEETPLTLDGMDYMKYAVHGESELWFPLQGDYDMIRYLQDNVEGTPVVMEAHLYPSEYHWGGRISIYTGLPTVLGWRFHQIQQHSLQYMNLLVQTRENNVAAFYELSGPEGIRTAMSLGAHYDVEYIVVGALERAFYGDIRTDPDTRRQTVGYSPGLAKFDEMVDLGLLDVVYDAPRCLDYGTDIEECSPDQVYHDKIYRFVPGAEYDPAAVE